MEVLHAGEPAGTAAGPNVWRYVQQASASFARGPLTLEAGIYPSHIGFESLQSQLNWTYTRSWMGELSPYYQTGLKGTWRFNDAWSAQLHLINGWQNIGENNHGKALGTQVAYAGERLSASFNTFIGEEGSEDRDGLRLFGDVVATYKVTDGLQPGLHRGRGHAAHARVRTRPCGTPPGSTPACSSPGPWPWPRAPSSTRTVTGSSAAPRRRSPRAPSPSR